MRLKFEDEMESAATAGMAEVEARNSVKLMIRADQDPGIADADLEQDAVETTVEPASPEQSLAALKGASYVGWLLDRMRTAGNQIEACWKRILETKVEVEGRFKSMAEYRRDNWPEAVMAALDTVRLMIVVTVCTWGELHLLEGVVGDFTGLTSLPAKVAAAAVFLAFFSWLAHNSMSISLAKPGRALCSLLLGVDGIALAYMRAMQSESEGIASLVLVFWITLSIGAPIVVASLFEASRPRVAAWLRYLSGMRFHTSFLDRLETEIAEQKEVITAAELSRENCVRELTAAFKEWNSREASAAARKREARRDLERGIEQHLMVYRAPREKNERSIPGIVMGVVIGITALLFLLGSIARAAESSPVAAHMVIICDRSSSGGNLSCSKENIAGVFEVWAGNALESQKGSFEVLIVGSDVSDVKIWMTIPAPSKKDLPPPLSQSRRKWVRNTLESIRKTSLETKGRKEASSAIVEAIYDVSFRLAGKAGKKRVIVMSDLRQVTPGKFDFERGVPSSAVFLKWLTSLGPKPQLADVELNVCGFHPQAPGGSPLDLKSLLRLRQVWEATFEFWGKQGLPITEECAS